VGYNPTRRFTPKPLDYVLVASALVLTFALVAWGLFG
jgi:hypothetical protein